MSKRDYWSDILKLADKKGVIKPITNIKERRPLEKYLAKGLKLSIPVINRLLLEWEKEGKIILERNFFPPKIVGLEILSEWKTPERKEKQLSAFNKKQEKNRVLVLIDLENLLRGVKSSSPKEFSVEEGFNKFIGQVTEDVGSIIKGFVFAPPHLASLYANEFYKMGFFTILCPKIKNKGSEDQDSVDKVLQKLGCKEISHNPSLTHICLGSGDKDFSDLIQEAKLTGLKIMILAGSIPSLASDVIKLADKNPKTGKKLIYLFSQTED